MTLYEKAVEKVNASYHFHLRITRMLRNEGRNWSKKRKPSIQITVLALTHFPAIADSDRGPSEHKACSHTILHTWLFDRQRNAFKLLRTMACIMLHLMTSMGELAPFD